MHNINDYLARWALDDVSGTTCVELTGTYPGTYVNSPTLGVAGAYGNSKGVTFADVSSQAITLTSAPLVALMGSNYTISFWCKESAYGANKFAFAIGGPDIGIAPFHTSQVINTHNGASLAASANGTGPAADGNWHLVTCVVTANTLVAFVDGVSIGQISSGGSFDLSGNGTIYIGKLFAGASFYNGSLDDVRIYGRALSPTEVMMIYRENFPAIMATNDPIAWYKLNELSGLTARDSSGNEFKGTYSRDAANTTLAGKIDTCYSPNNAFSDFVSLNVPTTFLPPSGTITFWIKDLNSTFTQTLVSKGLNDQVAVFEETGLLKLRMGGTGSDVSWTIANTTGWHLFGISWSGTTGRIYKNGLLVASGTINAVPASNAKTWRIAQFDPTTGGYYGTQPLDDIRLYARSLAAEEHLAIYNLYNPGNVSGIVNPMVTAMPENARQNYLACLIGQGVI